MRKFHFILLGLFCISLPSLYAQQQNIILNRDYNCVLERAIIQSKQTVHTSSKPFLFTEIDSLISVDSIISHYYNTDPIRKSTWLSRKLTQEHLASVNQNNINLYVDVLFDFDYGKEFNA